jgi:Holliday junction resolvase RusA-like endonuclease
MRFIIEGVPISKARPRFARRGNFVTTYDPQHNEKMIFRDKLSLALQEAFNSENKQIVMEASNLASGEFFEMRVSFHLPIPKSATQAKRNALLWGFEEHATKPDVDNLGKWLLDCCNGIFFRDDMHIYLLKCTKRYANKPRTIIDIMSKKNFAINDKARGILEIFGPEQLIKFAEDVSELYTLYDVDEKDDWVAKEVGEENTREVRLARTAYLLSMISDTHGKLLDKINRKFPGFWKDAERIAQEVSNVLEKEKSQSTSDVHKASDDRALQCTR